MFSLYRNDSVLVVDKFGHYHCNTSNPTYTFNHGNTTVNLDKPGPIYFISGDPNHCKNGQRLVIEVSSLSLPFITNPSYFAMQSSTDASTPLSYDYSDQANPMSPVMVLPLQ
ncbi:hypothetical protein Vadar_001760 [Vaccinium darrowii]|uniref:Uncharacterized protein n=1 Tax=Vaccinium darrowii TaxID=229202 RepID=A0ACB7Z1R5_9ERIC|nr:hypothetical protein Vadar_001760 [Vaccinium darrowii]